MKWRNIDAGAAYYYITGTFTEWLPLLNNPTIRDIVCEEITRALNECDGLISAFVIMPDHIHLLIYLPESGLLHKFNKLWRGRSAIRIIEYAKKAKSSKVLDVMEKHANGKSQYAVWKEQVRALAIYNEKKLYAMVDYIHANPVRRKIASHLKDWEFSSWRFYEHDEPVALNITPLIR